jgi:hypothetical protein
LGHRIVGRVDARPEVNVGPIALFDKSFLQSLSTDESVWFDHFFLGVIAPVFYAETLADLHKSAREGKTPEDEVAIIASKTPEVSGTPVVFHRHMVIGDLLGHAAPMNGRIPVAGARTVRHGGQTGAVLELTPERKAFDRWQQGRFFDVEHFHARAWRDAVQSVDLEEWKEVLKASGISRRSFRTVDDAYAMAKDFVGALTKSPGRFERVFTTLGVPKECWRDIKDRWKAMKRPPLSVFAPYAAHVATVDFFFNFAIAADHIAPTRASNRVDIAYLYYLPFCSVFISSDKLHRLCAPPFLRTDQEFVWGPDLKASLIAINAHYAALPDDERAKPLYQLAPHLPADIDGLVHDLAKRHAPGMLPGRHREVDLKAMDPQKLKELGRTLSGWKTAPPAPPQLGRELDSFTIQRVMRAKRGSWMQIDPSDIKDAAPE